MLGTRRSSITSVGLLGMICLPAAAMAAEKVAVLETVQSAVKLKLQIRGAVFSALDKMKVALVPIEDLTDEDAKCDEPGCTTDIAKRTSATHILVVEGVANPAGYRFSFELRDGESGRSLGTDGKDCELCATEQIAPMVRERIMRLWKRVAEEQAAAAAPTPKPKRAVVLAPPRRQQGPVIETTTVTPWWKQPTPLLGLGLGAVGLLGVGFGIYYVAQDGKSLQKSEVTGNPIWVRDTGKWGWTLVGVGAVSVIGGVAMLIWGQEAGQNVSVSVGPGSLGLQGKF